MRKFMATVLCAFTVISAPALGKAKKAVEVGDYFKPRSTQSMPGVLMVGAQYCLNSSDCNTVGADIVGFHAGDRPIGGVQGCLDNPTTPVCLQSEIPVEVYDFDTPIVIVRLNSHFYQVTGVKWTHNTPLGPIGGPVMIQYQGVMMPISVYEECYIPRQATLIGRNPCANMPGSPFRN